MGGRRARRNVAVKDWKRRPKCDEMEDVAKENREEYKGKFLKFEQLIGAGYFYSCTGLFMNFWGPDTQIKKKL